MVPVLHPFLRKVKSFSRFACHLAVLCFAPVFLLCADVPEFFCGFSRFFQFAQFIVDSGTGFILYWTGRNHLRSQDSFIWHSKCISPDEAFRRARTALVRHRRGSRKELSGNRTDRGRNSGKPHCGTDEAIPHGRIFQVRKQSAPCFGALCFYQIRICLFDKGGCTSTAHITTQAS